MFINLVPHRLYFSSQNKILVCFILFSLFHREICEIFVRLTHRVYDFSNQNRNFSLLCPVFIFHWEICEIFIRKYNIFYGLLLKGKLSSKSFKQHYIANKHT